MKAYLYNNISGEYIKEIKKQLDPLESKLQKKEIYLLPSNSTDIEPPVIKENEVIVFENNEWIIIPDHRNEKFYKKDTKEEVTIKTIGEIPETLINIKPKDTDKWDINTNKWIEDSDLILKKENYNKKLIIEEKIQKEIRKIAIENLINYGDLTEEDLNLINDSIPIATKD